MARLGRKLEAHGGTLIAAPETEVRSVFPTAAAAVTAALRIQLSPSAVGSRGPHTAKNRSSARRTRGARIAIHAGEAGHSGESDAVTAADRAVLLLRASHRGQILVSGTAVERARDRMPGARRSDRWERISSRTSVRPCPCTNSCIPRFPPGSRR
jgi:hypothetical protein